MNLKLNIQKLFLKVSELLKDFTDKLAKKIPKDKKVLATVLLGFMGMLIIMFSGNSEANAAQAENNYQKNTYDENEISFQLENLIEQIDGVGKATVMITYEEGQEIVFAKDEEKDGGENDFSENKEYIIIDSKDGETGLELKTIYPKVMGVAVVCQGAESNIIRQQVVEIICALFDISSNNISVAAMSE